VIILAERLISIDDGSTPNPAAAAAAAVKAGARSVRSSSILSLEVDYVRELSSGTVAGSVVAGAVQYRINVRLVEQSSSTLHAAAAAAAAGAGGADAASSTSRAPWDVSLLLDLAHHVRLQGGRATIGLAGSAVQLAPGLVFGTDIYAFYARVRGALATYPVASPFTSTRHPETFLRLEAELEQIRAWLGLQLQFRFPAIFGIIFDSDALAAYERLFAFIMKVCLRLSTPFSPPFVHSPTPGLPVLFLYKHSIRFGWWLTP